MYHRGLRRAQKARLKAPLLKYYAQRIRDDQYLELSWETRWKSLFNRPKYKDDAARQKAYLEYLKGYLRNEGKARHRWSWIPKIDGHRRGYDMDDHLTYRRRCNSSALDDELKLWERDYLNPSEETGPYGYPLE